MPPSVYDRTQPNHNSDYFTLSYIFHIIYSLCGCLIAACSNLGFNPISCYLINVSLFGIDLVL